MHALYKNKPRFAAACTIAFLLCNNFVFAQKTTKDDERFQSVYPGIFDDASRHWYVIANKENIINAHPGQAKYKTTQLTEIADNILLFQKDNGGWPKNYDMLAILTDAQKDSVLTAKHETNTTFDNRTTYSHIAALAKVYYVTKTDKY